MICRALKYPEGLACSPVLLTFRDEQPILFINFDMQLTLAAIIASAAFLVGAAPQPRLICPEAVRFGVLIVSPTTVAAGDVSETFWLLVRNLANCYTTNQNLTVNADFNCAINYFGIIPEYTDYYIEAPVNSGYKPPILLARRTLSPGSTCDSFTVQVHSFLGGDRHVL